MIIKIITGDDEHDLHTRAYCWFGWKSGFMPLDWIEEKQRTFISKTEDEKIILLQRKQRSNGGYSSDISSKNIQSINDVLSFEEKCKCSTNKNWWLKC